MANKHERGQVIRLHTRPPFRNDAGVETDPTTVTVRVTDPEAATTDYTLSGGQVIKDTTVYANGDFYYDLPTAGLGDGKCGVWIYAWIGTGTVAAVQKNVFQLLNEKTRE